jgi:N-acetylglutamate synthase-like GNAT family acetyltransferase
MFADAALAARIDRAEGRFVASVVEGVGARRTDLRTLIQPVSGGLSVYAGSNSPMNKVIGLGFDGPIDLEPLEAIEREWRARDEAVRIELSILADSSIPVTLSERGYHVHGYENVLGRPLDVERAADDPPGVTVERLQKEDERTWIDIAVEAFTHLDGTGSAADDSSQTAVMEEVMGDFLAAPGIHTYLSRLDGRPVGEGAMCLAGDNIALLAGAGTIPDARGRGVQKALLRRRLADAREAGAELAVVVTAPGTRSQENVMRRGFILLYTRIILVKRWNISPNQ